MTTFGINFSCLRDFLNPCSPISERTAFLVISLPVPEVVGMAMKGTVSPGCSRSPTPSRYLFTCSSTSSIADTALPASITLPPPTATTTLIPAFRYLPAISSPIAGEGSVPIDSWWKVIPWSERLFLISSPCPEKWIDVVPVSRSTVFP